MVRHEKLVQPATWSFAETEVSLLGCDVKANFQSEEKSMATDPVCGMKVDDKNPQYRAQFAGKKYTFCSETCRQEFESNPDEYIEAAA
jgi:YHS domain-containing protein